MVELEKFVSKLDKLPAKYEGCIIVGPDDVYLEEYYRHRRMLSWLNMTSTSTGIYIEWYQNSGTF